MHFLTDALTFAWNAVLFLLVFIVGIVKFAFMVLIGWWLKALLIVIVLMAILLFVVYRIVNKKPGS